MNIRDFCGKRDTRHWMAEPMNIDGKTFATNGFSLMAIPQEAGHKDCPESIQKGIRNILDQIAGADFQPMPVLDFPPKSVCVACDGKGKASVVECEECEGHGVIEYNTCCHDYEWSCKSCDGEGEKTTAGGNESCPKCRGRGSVFERSAIVEIDGMSVNPSLILLISDEPGLEVAVVKETRMLVFRTRNACGAIMGMKS